MTAVEFWIVAVVFNQPVQHRDFSLSCGHLKNFGTAAPQAETRRNYALFDALQPVDHCLFIELNVLFRLKPHDSYCPGTGKKRTNPAVEVESIQISEASFGRGHELSLARELRLLSTAAGGASAITS